MSQFCHLTGAHQSVFVTRKMFINHSTFHHNRRNNVAKIYHVVLRILNFLFVLDIRQRFKRNDDFLAS